MDIEVTELRPRHCERVAALFAASDGEDAAKLTADFISRTILRMRCLSLVAGIDAEVLGAVLCIKSEDGCFQQKLVVAKHERAQEITQRLADGATAKLSRLQINKCQLHLATPEDEHDAFWREQRWTDRPDFTGSPTVGAHVPDPTDPDDPTCPFRDAAPPEENTPAAA